MDALERSIKWGVAWLAAQGKISAWMPKKAFRTVSGSDIGTLIR